MTRNSTLFSGKLALATVVATGMAAAPVALNPGLVPLPNAASAQTESSGSPGAESNGYADERAEKRATGTAGTTGSSEYDVDMSAAEDDVYRILGTSREEAESADTHTSATAQYGPLKAYQAEVERGNLDAAAENLAAIAGDPITEEMVTKVNTELGVETTLTAKQIADVAERKQTETNY